MEYDKKNFQKTDDKKVLHKIRKHWVVVSTALLMALGGGAVATTHVSANADATNANNGNNTSSVNTLKERLNQQLQTPQQQSNNDQAQAPVNNSENNSQSNQNTSKTITGQAAVLHDRIMMNAGRDNYSVDQQTNDDTGQGHVNANVNTPKVNNNGVNVGKVNTNNVTKQSATSNNGLEAANDNNNKVILNRRPRMLLGLSPNSGNDDSGDTNDLFSNGEYKSDQSDGAKYLSYQNYSDAYGRYNEFGEVTVEYVNGSDQNRILGSATVVGPVLAKSRNTVPFGGTTSNPGADVQGFAKEIPQVRIGDGDDYGYKFAGYISGQNIKYYEPGENQFLVINVDRKPAPAQPGRVIVNYLDKDNDNEIVSSRSNSDLGGTSFNWDGYLNNVPHGYMYTNSDYSDNVTGTMIHNGQKFTKYGSNKTYTLNVYVTPVSNTAQANVYYRDASDNNKVVATQTLYGTYKNPDESIGLDKLEQFLPAGYDLDTSAQGSIQNQSDFQSKANQKPIYIEVTKDPNSSTAKDITNYGSVTIHYKTSLDSTSDVFTTTSVGPNGKSFNDADYIGTNIPAGYTYVTDTNVNPTQEYPAVKTYNSGVNQNFVVTVEGSKPSQNTKVSDYIQYQSVDPNNPSDLPVNVGNPIKVTGNYGSQIPFSHYSTFVPSGYAFWKWDNVAPNDKNFNMNNHTYYALIEKDTNLVGTMTINYYDQNGHLVSSSELTAKSPNYKYGEHFTAGQLATNKTGYHLNQGVSSDYVLNSDEDNQEYYVGSDNQIVNLQVHGKPVNQKKSDAHYDLWVKTIIKSPGEHGSVIGHNEVALPISGSNGDVITINPSSYEPSPSSDYTSSNSDQQVRLVPLWSPKSGNGKSDQFGIEPVAPENTETSIASDGKMTTTFTYVENNASATVLYEEPSDGYKVVGSTQINGAPDTVMSTFYNGTNGKLDTFIPYGYKNATPDPSNNPKLVNGNTYVIDVDNANLAPGGNSNNKVPGQGYINIVYGSNLNPANLSAPGSTVYSTVTRSASDTTPFLSIYATETVENGGWMPDTYTNANVTDTNIDAKDASVTKFLAGTPQTYYVDVSLNSDTVGKPVSDMIVYQVLNSNGTVDTSVGNNGVLTSDILTIKGKNGAPINYAPYQTNLPSSYSYFGQTKTNTSVYTNGYDSSTNPAAIIYLVSAQNASTNNFPGYDPDNNLSHKGKNNGQPVNAPTSKNKNGVTASDGMYFPFNINASDVPVDPTENPHDTLPGFNPQDPLMPDNYQGDSDGYVPMGYVPAWITTGQGVHKAGYVPSDNIPTGYVPGLVPNGNGGYVAGYVPNTASDMPSGSKNQGTTITITGKNGQTKTIYIPKYVPGYIPDGHGGVTPGYVPATSKYAKDTAGILQIQYVNADNHNQIISDFLVGGAMGSDLDLTKAGLNGNHNYLSDLPAGYDNASDLGEEQTEGDISSSKLADPTHPSDAKNHIYGYDYKGQSHTINIAVHKMATANVIYEDLDNGKVQVGSAPISGDENTPIDFGTTDNQYEQLLPYNYVNPTIKESDTGYTNPSVLYNGATYVIGVHEAGHRPATAPQANSDYGTIVVNYVTTRTDSQNEPYDAVVGTESFVGKDTTSISNPQYNDLGNSYVPYGYTNPNQDDVQAAQGATFQKGKQLIYKIHVTPDASTENQVDKTIPNYIGYEVEESDGTLRQLDYKSGGGVTTSDQHGATGPVTFMVTGPVGSTINYAPYQLDVPDGYEYNGMGNYSSIIDQGHNEKTNPKGFDTILLRQDAPTTKQGDITINYYQLKSDVSLTGDGSSSNPYTSDDNKALKKYSTNYSDYDSITVSGPAGSQFNQGYFEDDLPSDGNGWQFYHANNNVTQYSTTPQTLNIYATPKAKPAAQYTNINIHFINASDVTKYHYNSDTPEATLEATEKSENHVSETMSGHVGDLFNPQEYEYNTPANTTFAGILAGSDDLVFEPTDQNIWIEVSSDSTGSPS